MSRVAFSGYFDKYEHSRDFLDSVRGHQLGDEIGRTEDSRIAEGRLISDFFRVEKVRSIPYFQRCEQGAGP